MFPGRLITNERKKELPEKADSQITSNVLDELYWDPAISIANLTVSTIHHRVTLTGTTATYSTRLEAEIAAYRVSGVYDVENNIIVDAGAPSVRSDDDIADDVMDALALDSQVPDDRIAVNVLNGGVTLTGTVDWYYQSRAAAEDASKLSGVTSVDNDIVVMQPETSAAVVSSGIARAFARDAALCDDELNTSANDGNVTLSGTVTTWSEREMAEEVAWRSPGVTSVTNNITIVEE
jgi:osmotically-inducible protein OsmY